VIRGLGRTAALSLSNVDPGAQSLGLASGQTGSDRMVVDIASGTARNRTLVVRWRNDRGEPVVEQVRVSGLLGDDDIAFVQAANALDVGGLGARSNDFVGVIDGGPGNDTLAGTPRPHP